VRPLFNGSPGNAIQEQAPQQNAGKVRAKICLSGIGLHGSATRRLALASSGVTTTDTAATMMPGMLRSAISCRVIVEPDSWRAPRTASWAFQYGGGSAGTH
jgi:hypothetical protein